MDTAFSYEDLGLIVAFASSNAVVICATYGLLITGITAYCIKDSVYYWKPLSHKKKAILYFFLIAPFFYGIIILLISIILYLILMLILYVFGKHTDSYIKSLVLICSVMISTYISIKVFMLYYNKFKRSKLGAT